MIWYIYILYSLYISYLLIYAYGLGFNEENGVTENVSFHSLHWSILFEQEQVVNHQHLASMGPSLPRVPHRLFGRNHGLAWWD